MGAKKEQFRNDEYLRSIWLSPVRLLKINNDVAIYLRFKRAYRVCYSICSREKREVFSQTKQKKGSIDPSTSFPYSSLNFYLVYTLAFCMAILT